MLSCTGSVQWATVLNKSNFLSITSTKGAVDSSGFINWSTKVAVLLQIKTAWDKYISDWGKTSIVSLMKESYPH